MVLSIRTRAFGFALSFATLGFATTSFGQPAPTSHTQPAVPGPAAAGVPLLSTRDLIARLPASASLAVSIDHAARQRVSGPGRSLWEFIQEAKLMHRTQGAWTELAAVLGLSPQQAFDELLGRRAVFVLSASKTGGRARWALMSEVTPQVENRIRQSLSPAPRSIERGRPILTLERGAYELATTAGRPGHLQPPGSPTDEMILLAPSEDSAFFDELLAVLSGHACADAIGTIPEWSRARAIKQGDVFVWCSNPGLLGPRPNGDAPEPDARGFVAFSAEASRRGWDAEFVSSAALSVWDNQHATPLPAGVAAIERGAMMSYSGSLPLDGESGTRELRHLAEALVPKFSQALLQHLGPTVVFALHPEAQGLDADSPTQIALSVAVRTSDVRRTAHAADEFVAWAVRRGTGPGRSGLAAATASELDFSALAPWQTRTLERRGEPIDARDGTPDAAVAWACVPDDEPKDGEAVRGWWFTGVALGAGPRGTAPGRLDAMRSMGTCSDRDPAGVTARLVVRPALFLQTLAPRARAMPEFMRALRWFELVSSECFTPHEGMVHGRIRVEMALPPVTDPNKSSPSDPKGSAR